ncbi:MAG: hypothetical protein AAF541_05245 [Pseudomonadota bacterium]
MGKAKHILSWCALILLGVINAVLEDLMFAGILVPNLPPSIDMTGDLFWLFPVPLAQLMALAITGSIAWFFLQLRQPKRLLTFWASWTIARTAFLSALYNPMEDIAIYLLWIAIWCALLGLLARHFSSTNSVTA